MMHGILGRSRRRGRWGGSLAAAVLAGVVAGCAALGQLGALRHVDFELDRVAEVDLAGVRIDGKRSLQDLSVVEAARLATAVVAGSVPLTFVAHVDAQNPEGNATARLLAMRWTAYIEDRETVSGDLDREFELPAGTTVDVPVRVGLDLYHTFGGQANDLFRLAQSVAGVGAPTRVALRARPVVSTPLGPITYPGEITIVHRDVGGVREPSR
jgi:hypothetical protein